MVIEIFGVNASGKDSVAKAIAQRRANIFVTTETRLLMYHLNIIGGFAADCPVTTDQYKKLEDTPQDEIAGVTNGSYKASLEKFRAESSTTLLLSHLVFLLHIGKEPTFLDQKDPPHTDLFAGLVNIKASTASILERRQRDNASGSRERNHSEADIIEQHQRLCDAKWVKLIANRPQGTFLTVVNEELGLAVAQVDGFISHLRG